MLHLDLVSLPWSYPTGCCSKILAELLGYANVTVLSSNNVERKKIKVLLLSVKMEGSARQGKKGKLLVSLSIATGEDKISEESVTGEIVGYENSD